MTTPLQYPPCDRESTRARVCVCSVWTGYILTISYEQITRLRIVMYIWSDCSFVWVKRFRAQSHAVILAVLGNLDSRILISLSWAEGVKPVRTSRRVVDDVFVVVGEGTTWANKNGDSALTSWCRPWLGHLHTGSSLRQLRFVTDYCQRASHCCSQANILYEKLQTSEQECKKSNNK